VTIHRKRTARPERHRTAAEWRHSEWCLEGDSLRDLYVGGRPLTAWEGTPGVAGGAGGPGVSAGRVAGVGRAGVKDCLVCGRQLSNGARCCCRPCWHDLLTRFHGTLTLAEAAAVLLWAYWGETAA
jgi:hypothetical protein